MYHNQRQDDHTGLPQPWDWESPLREAAASQPEEVQLLPLCRRPL